MNDRELIALAAKAANLTPYDDTEMFVDSEGDVTTFDPLNDDGDAFRLMSTLRIDLHFENQPNWIGELVEAYGPEGEDGSRHCETHALADNPPAVVRLAIVRSAAEIGRKMEAPQAG